MTANTKNGVYVGVPIGPGEIHVEIITAVYDDRDLVCGPRPQARTRYR